MLIAAAPSYLKQHPASKMSSTLSSHPCINRRFSIRGGVYAWELKKSKKKLQVRVAGGWTFNSIYPVVEAALPALGGW